MSRRHRALMNHEGLREILSVSAQTGVVTERWTSPLVLSNVNIFKEGENRSILFNGSTSKINCGDPHDLTGDITCVAWIKPYGWGEGGGGRGYIFSNNKLIFSLYGATARFVVNRNSVEGLAGTIGITKLNEWQMVAIASTSGGLTDVYYNGVLDTDDFAAGVPAAGSNIIIGNNNGQSRTFDGLISDARIYEGILSAPEINRLFTAESKKYLL